jgi:hypothetical protein
LPHSLAAAFQPRLRVALLAAAATIALLALLRAAPAELSLPSQSSAEVAAERAYGELPLSFERNVGQQPAAVDYLARTDAGTFFLTGWGARLVADAKGSSALDLRLVGAGPAEPRALGRLRGEVNYLVGEDPSGWHRGVPTFEAVRYPGAYPGIDLDWHGNRRALEYDFRLAPGADPSLIALRLKGADSLTIAPNGDLLITANGRTLRQRAPIAYQLVGGERRQVASAYRLDGDTVSFGLGAYDRSRPLVIDPLVLAYSTYLGGDNTDRAHAIAVDLSGAAYVAGQIDSTDFNTVGPIESDGGDFNDDAFISKLNAAGSALAYSTYLGGSLSDAAHAIAVDSSGAAYVAGETASTDFNTASPIESNEIGTDAFVSKLTAAGSALLYSTYLGGNSTDSANAIAVDSSGAAYVAGQTDSTEFNTMGPIEGDGTVTDAFVSKLNPAGSALAYSTYLGGNLVDAANAIAVDSSGAAYVAGETGSTDFNTMGPIEGDGTSSDAFISKLTAAGSALAYSTYLGGNGADNADAIAVDSSGAAYVAGETYSTDFNTMGPIESDGADADADAFISKLTAAGSALAYSTYLGGGGADFANAIAVDASGAAYVAGETGSTDFNTVGPIEGDGTGTDAFISKLAVPAPTITDTDPDSPANDNTLLVKGAAAAATTVRVYANGSCTGIPLAAAPAAEFASPGLAVTVADNSTTALHATDTDAASVVSACSAAFPYTEDSAQPNSTISRVRVNSRRRRATVTFSGTDAVSSPSALDFECKLDGRAFAPCGSPKTYRKLKPGRHTVKVRATDEVGNLETSVASRSFRVRRR